MSFGSFNGTPLELLRLVAQGRIDAASLPLAEISRGFFEALEAQDKGQVDLDQAVDQVVALVALASRKARGLLPSDTPQTEGQEACDDVEPPDEPGGLREVLLQRLDEYKDYKRIAEELRRREELWHKVRSRPCSAKAVPGTPVPERQPDCAVTLDDLLTALEALIKSVPDNVPVPGEELSIQDRMEDIVSRLRASGRLGFRELLAGSRSRSEVIAMFVALLELIRIGKVRATQDQHFGEIFIAITEPH